MHQKNKKFVEMPFYKGGNKALIKFILDELKYPAKAKENKREGTVFLKYTINHKGIVIKTEIIHGIGYGCDEEAARLVKLLKFEIPSLVRGMKTLFHKNIKIHFRLGDEKAPIATLDESDTDIRYEFKPTDKNNQETNKSNYSYTIDIPYYTD